MQAFPLVLISPRASLGLNFLLPVSSVLWLFRFEFPNFAYSVLCLWRFIPGFLCLLSSVDLYLWTCLAPSVFVWLCLLCVMYVCLPVTVCVCSSQKALFCLYWTAQRTSHREWMENFAEIFNRVFFKNRGSSNWLQLIPNDPLNKQYFKHHCLSANILKWMFLIYNRF